MRSGLIFNVASKVPNRYMLCRMVSVSARKMHHDGASTSQSINRSLQALHDVPADGAGAVAPPEETAQVKTDV